jgi:hypothetical protein
MVRPAKWRKLPPAVLWISLFDARRGHTYGLRLFRDDVGALSAIDFPRQKNAREQALL